MTKKEKQKRQAKTLEKKENTFKEEQKKAEGKILALYNHKKNTQTKILEKENLRTKKEK